MSLEVKRCGDRELWVLSGVLKDGFRWQIPFYADPYAKDENLSHYKVEPAVFMNGPMLDTVDALLLYHNQGKGNVRLLSRLQWTKMATKAPGITPEYYLKWNTFEEQADSEMDVQPVLENPDPDMSSEAEAFCRHVVQATQIVPIGTMKLVYRVIMSEGLIWMLEKGKPLNLGFIRLARVPYRPNWKQILLSMFPASASYFRQPATKRDTLLHNSGFWANLYNTKLASLDRKDHFIHWGVECVEQPSWWAASDQKERSILSSLGSAKYMQYFRNAIKKHIPTILESYRSWIDRVIIPCAALDNGRVFGSQVLRPWVPEGRVLPAAPDAGDCHVVPDEEFAKLIGPNDKGDLREKNVPMRRLRGLLQRTGDVREPEDGIEVVENGAEAADSGVPLLNEGKEHDT